LKTIVVCSSVILILFFSSVLAPYLGLIPYDEIHLSERLLPPSPSHWLGTDELGRDVLSRLLFGGRVSFLVSLIVVSISLVIGVALGSISGWAGGWIDEVIMRFADVLLAFPGILLAIGIMAVLGPSLTNVVIALVFLGWVIYARLARALTLKLRELDFVQASKSIGASSFRILLRHIFPNMIPTLLVQASFSFAAILLAEAALSFLGLGVQPPDPSWGSMLSEGKNHLLDTPQLMLFPGLTIFISVLAFNLLGDGLRDRLDPRFRS
jgi:ABC-type dipeptide/oligopeptide/nickel transport system permease subunit